MFSSRVQSAASISHVEPAQAALSFFRSAPGAFLSDYFRATCRNAMLPYTHFPFWLLDKKKFTALQVVKARLSDSAAYMQ